MSKQSPIMLSKYKLTVDGLTIRYRETTGSTILQFDPFATCALLHEAHIIEGFDSDGKEPVILYTHSYVKPYGQELWVHFVKRFILDESVAELIAEWHYAQKKGISLTSSNSQPSLEKTELILPNVLPPTHLYNLHNYYYEHICSRDKGSAAGAATRKNNPGNRAV